jgi:ABC-type transport system involved in multi-copper enzyme maturation permease subunit
MTGRILAIASNTFREAVRDRVLYNLVVFAVLMMGASLLLGQISIDIERLFLINMGLTAISIFGVLIAIFIGIGLVSKEIEKRTLYTLLSRPVRRWEFVVGKFLGLVGTLVVNVSFMTIAFFAGLLIVGNGPNAHGFQAGDGLLLLAIYFIILEFIVITALATLFSTFSSPILSAVLSFALFIVGSFANDLRGMAMMAHGYSSFLIRFAAYLVPNFSSFNIISTVSHGEGVSGALVLHNTAYAFSYSLAVLCGAVLIFERRNFK